MGGGRRRALDGQVHTGCVRRNDGDFSSPSIETKSGVPNGIGAFRTIAVSVAKTFAAKADVFAAHATSDPDGRLPTFCVFAAFSFTVMGWPGGVLPLAPGKRAETTTAFGCGRAAVVDEAMPLPPDGGT